MTALRKSQLQTTLIGMMLCLGLATSASGQITGSAGQPALNDASPNGAIAAYQDFTKYPPDSRPLHASNWDLLHPWAADTSSLPMLPPQVAREAEALRASGLPEEEVLRSIAMPPVVPRYRFEMNKTILAGTHDELRARLIVGPDPNSAAA